MVRKVCCVLSAALILAPIALPPQAAVAPTTSALGAANESLRTSSLLRMLNKQVTLEGYYYDNGVMKMLVSDMDMVRAKTVMPTSAYVPIAGTVPGSVNNGDKISVQGLLIKPGASDEDVLKNENAAVRVSAESSVRVVDTKARLRMVPAINLVNIENVVPVQPISRNKYALLSGGGYSWASEGICFRNGLLAAKQLLLSKGYKPENIHVLYGSGTVPGGGLSPVLPATKPNIISRFSLLASQVQAGDTVFIMVSANGGGILTTPSAGYPKGMLGGLIDTSGDESESYSESAMNVDLNRDGDRLDTVRVDETFWVWPSVPFSDDEFRQQVNRLNPNCKMIVIMDQSFSGGFIRDLTKTGRIITASTGTTLLSFNNSSNTWDSFTEWWLAALMGRKPFTVTPVNADANGDGKISLVEAFNFARVRSYPPGVAGYEDNGVYPGFAFHMPYGGDGALGMLTFL